MRCIVRYFPAEHPPALQLSIHYAPHRRMHRAVLQKYRELITASCVAAGVPLPLTVPIDLSILFVSPSSPDLDNLLMAFYQAIDGKTLKGLSLLEDDSLISKATVSKYYPEGLPVGSFGS